MVKRQIKYYVSTHPDEQILQRYEWTIFIINEPKEIDRITDRMFGQLAIVGDYSENYNSLIRGSKGLHCKVFSFFSDKGKFEDKSKIYDSSNFRKDRDLSVQRDEIGWGKYLERIL